MKVKKDLSNEERRDLAAILAEDWLGIRDYDYHELRCELRDELERLIELGWRKI